jgi:gamma-glutamyl hydrolase
MENRLYPFFGVQFHPEKDSKRFYNNDKEGQFNPEINDYFTNFFVAQASINTNSFNSESDRDKMLIKNF